MIIRLFAVFFLFNYSVAAQNTILRPNWKVGDKKNVEIFVEKTSASVTNKEHFKQTLVCKDTLKQAYRLELEHSDRKYSLLRTLMIDCKLEFAVKKYFDHIDLPTYKYNISKEGTFMGVSNITEIKSFLDGMIDSTTKDDVAKMFIRLDYMSNIPINTSIFTKRLFEMYGISFNGGSRKDTTQQKSSGCSIVTESSFQQSKQDTNKIIITVKLLKVLSPIANNELKRYSAVYVFNKSTTWFENIRIETEVMDKGKKVIEKTLIKVEEYKQKPQ
jgi:hypothetical protein